VRASSFFDCFLLRLSEAPQLKVEVLESADQPGGMGEVTGGKRLRRLPNFPERVLVATRV
jgi:hypothetical protein